MSVSDPFFSPAPGVALRTRRAAAAAPVGSVVVVHGRAEFVEKYDEVLAELAARGWDAWTFDLRGQGLSTRPLPDRHKGHIDSYDTYVADLAAFVREVYRPVPGPRLLMAHSMGGNVALRFLAAAPDAFDGALMTAPLVDLQLPTLARPLVRWLAEGLVRVGRDREYLPGRSGYGAEQRRFEGNVVTSDPARFARSHDAIAARPELALGGPTVGWLQATFESSARLDRLVRAGAIRTRTELVLAGDEALVCNDAARDLARRLPRGDVTTIPGSRHEILVERDAIRARYWARFDRFVAGL